MAPQGAVELVGCWGEGLVGRVAGGAFARPIEGVCVFFGSEQ